jgi:hypothetical protein
MHEDTCSLKVPSLNEAAVTVSDTSRFDTFQTKDTAKTVTCQRPVALHTLKTVSKRLTVSTAPQYFT